MNTQIFCEFPGCTNQLTDEWQPKTGKKLCRQCAERFEKLVHFGDIADIMRFFVQCNTIDKKGITVNEEH